MKKPRVLISESLPLINEFYKAVKQIESLAITFYEQRAIINQDLIKNVSDLVNCINDPQSFIFNYYAKKIEIPETDRITGLTINRDLFLEAELKKLVLPNYNRLIELSNSIKNILSNYNITSEQVFKPQEPINTNNLLNKERIEAIADGRFREYAITEEERNFILAYKELINKANDLQKIYKKITGGRLNPFELLKQDEEEFKINLATYHYFKRDQDLKKSLIKQ